MDSLALPWVSTREVLYFIPLLIELGCLSGPPSRDLEGRKREGSDLMHPLPIVTQTK